MCLSVHFSVLAKRKKKENYRGQKPNKHAGKRSIKVIWMNGRIKVNYFASGH
jgi:hypothetical protein